MGIAGCKLEFIRCLVHRCPEHFHCSVTLPKHWFLSSALGHRTLLCILWTPPPLAQSEAWRPLDCRWLTQVCRTLPSLSSGPRQAQEEPRAACGRRSVQEWCVLDSLPAHSGEVQLRILTNMTHLFFPAFPFQQRLC